MNNKKIKIAHLTCVFPPYHGGIGMVALKQAQMALSEQILGKTVQLKNVKLEKYGRILCDVYLDEICLNDWMIEKRYAVVYEGKTKKSPTSWKDYYLNGTV